MRLWPVNWYLRTKSFVRFRQVSTLENVRFRQVLLYHQSLTILLLMVVLSIRINSCNKEIWKSLHFNAQVNMIVCWLSGNCDLKILTIADFDTHSGKTNNWEVSNSNSSVKGQKHQKSPDQLRTIDKWTKMITKDPIRPSKSFKSNYKKVILHPETLISPVHEVLRYLLKCLV